MASLSKQGFAARLRRYYTREGNRIIFSNKMTLNQLAWEMWEKLGYQEIDPSVLSRVLKGERLFSVRQLEIFCKLLRIKDKERGGIKLSLFNEVSKKFFPNDDFFSISNNRLVELLEYNLGKMLDVQNRDMPELTQEWAYFLIEKIEEILPLILDNSVKNKLLEIFVRYMNLYSWGFLVVNTTNMDFISIQKIMNKSLAISKKIGKPNFLGESYLNIGNSLYNRGEYQRSLKFLYSASNLIDINYDNKISGAPLRQLSLSLAYLHKEREFKEVSKQLYKRQFYYLPSLKCMSLEGLARGEAILGNRTDYARILNKAKSSVVENIKCRGQYTSLRELQVFITELESSRYLKGDVDLAYFENIGRKYLEAREMEGYKRHKDKLSRLLSLTLN